MSRLTVFRTFFGGLGVVLLATACGGDNIAGPPPGNPIGVSASVSDSSAADSLTAAALAQAAAAGPSGSTVPGTPTTPPPPDSSNTPSPPAPAADSTPRPGITRSHPLVSDITVSGVIGPKGGEIKIGEAGLTVVFSKGAVLQNTTITVTADAGSLVSYEFGPHGTQFLAPVAIEQDMHKTTFDIKASQTATLYGGYLAHGTSDITGTSAKVAELHATQTSVGADSSGKPQLKSAVYVVWHFSGYILISGRQ